jgi:menaquinone reductase, iron-sulfur cluster-binding subunit
MEQTIQSKSRYGMVVDLDRCTGCGVCMTACAVENNLAPAEEKATERTGITWLRVYPVSNGEKFPANDTVFIPMTCQQCGNHTPCVSVCPQNAVEVDPTTGIVGQIPQRCLGCRYCMTACPYHARYFNWWDPQWPKGTEALLNPDAAPRMRGVAEKCNFCHGRLHAARTKAAAEGKKEIAAPEYTPACVESCPAKALVFGDLADATSTVAQLSRNTNTFQFLPKLGTGPKIFYHSSKEWVRDMAGTPPTA